MIRNTRGFTLIELLVAVGLMIILIASVAMIFVSATDVFKISESRISIYGNARAALEFLARDLAGSLPSENGQQRFFLHDSSSEAGDNGTNGQNIPANGQGATDGMLFRATTSVDNSIRGVYVAYFLEEDDDPDVRMRAARTVNTNRKLYALVKRLRDFNGNPVLDSSGTQISDIPLCHFVVSFNIEMYAGTGPADNGFYQIDRGSTIPSSPALLYSDVESVREIDSLSNNLQGDPYAASDGWGVWPLGNGVPVPPNVEPPLPAALRITMRVVDGARENQERVVSRVIWIPIN